MAPRQYLLALLLALVSPAELHAQSAPAPSDAAQVAWNFDRSGLTPHPRVRFGVLPNGMRYALAPNTVPKGSLSVRLHVDAGSAAEGSREQGYMHLLEHLIFMGSASLPKGALQLTLPRQGLKRWSDFNAFTSYDETVYRLDLVRSDRGAREIALMLMREIASNLSFTRGTVEAAKSMVLEELGGRDAVQDKIMTARNSFLMPGTPPSRGPVAGTRASIRRVNRTELKRLYERTYVPARTTLVIAGDFDLPIAEAEVVARFSGWQGADPIPAGSPLPYRPIHSGSKARLFVDPNAPTDVFIAVVEPLGSPDGAKRRDRLFLEHLGAEMLSRRMAHAAAQGDAPFSAATSAIYDHFSTARLSTIEVATRDRDWQRALQASARALHQTLDQGFSPSELLTQLAASRRALAGDATPRTSQALADDLVDAVGRGIVYTARGDSSATAAYLAQVTLADVNTAFRAAWAKPSRLIFVTHNRNVRDAEAAISAAWSDGLRAVSKIARNANAVSGSTALRRSGRSIVTVRTQPTRSPARSP